MSTLSAAGAAGTDAQLAGQAIWRRRVDRCISADSPHRLYPTSVEVLPKGLCNTSDPYGFHLNT